MLKQNLVSLIVMPSSGVNGTPLETIPACWWPDDDLGNEILAHHQSEKNVKLDKKKSLVCVCVQGVVRDYSWR